MFNMKFHCDERSLDMTRRRRWHRKMTPDHFSFDQTLTDERMIANTDVVFRMQSKIDHPQMDLTPTKMKDIKIELSSPRIFLAFKSKFSLTDLSESFVKFRSKIGGYFYELRAYMYQARNLLSMDYDSFSGRLSFFSRERYQIL